MPITVTSDMYNVRSNYVYTGSYMSATWHSFNFLCSGPDLDDVDILLNNIQLQTNAEAPAMRCPFDGNFVKSWPWLSSGYLMPSLSYLVLPWCLSPCAGRAPRECVIIESPSQSNQWWSRKFSKSSQLLRESYLVNKLAHWNSTLVIAVEHLSVTEGIYDFKRSMSSPTMFW